MRPWKLAFRMLLPVALLAIHAGCGGGGGSSKPTPNMGAPVTVFQSISPNDATLRHSIPYTLTVTATDPDAGDSISKFEWDFGDGSLLGTTTVGTIQHPFVKSGTVTLKVRAFDSHNLAGDWMSKTFTVTTDPALLTLVQQKAFDFFYAGAHSSGLAYDRIADGQPGLSSLASGATGMGMMAIIVGVERGFITRQAGATRLATILASLKANTRYHGAWPHFIDPVTGDGAGPAGNDSYHQGDIVETAYVAEGLLAVMQYFNTSEATETQIRQAADELWKAIDWEFYRNKTTNRIYWHWSSDSGFDNQAEISGFNECMIVYLLGIASPTHPIPVSAYASGWAPAGYTTNLSYDGISQYIQTNWGWGRNISLFWTQYSYLGLDPRTLRDPQLGQAGAPAGFTYADVFRNITLINRAYCLDNHPTYGPFVWGLTASDDPNGYAAHSPVPFADGMGDNGTIAPTAALGAMAYTPDESYSALVAFHGDARLWGTYGFKDAFNPSLNWYANAYLGIDQGPIVIMIENARTRLLWKLFMSHPDISDAQTGLLKKLADAGWTITPQTY